MKKTRKITTFVLILATGVFLSLVVTLSAPDGSATAPVVQDMRGVYDGFEVRAGEPPDPVRTEITGGSRDFQSRPNPVSRSLSRERCRRAAG